MKRLKNWHYVVGFYLGFGVLFLAITKLHLDELATPLNAIAMFLPFAYLFVAGFVLGYKTNSHTLMAFCLLLFATLAWVTWPPDSPFGIPTLVFIAVPSFFVLLLGSFVGQQRSGKVSFRRLLLIYAALFAAIIRIHVWISGFD